MGRELIKKWGHVSVAPRQEEINLKILENLLLTAKKMNSTVLFFGGFDVDSLPLKIRSLLEKYQNMVVYVNAGQEMEKRINGYGFKHSELLNHSNHFNIKGNKIYAETVLDILKSHNWGTDKDRIFYYDELSNSFKNKNLGK